MVNQTTKFGRLWWAKTFLYIFWALVTVLALTTATALGWGVVKTHAAQFGLGDIGITDPGASNVPPFEEYLCNVIYYAGSTVGILAVIMIVLAGIMYAASTGGTTEFGSVTVAKEMIIAALTGAALYMLGAALLGPCGGSATGGWIRQLLQ
ncbi:MAG: hypothetical protein V1826_00830 [bacterium]